MACTGGQMTGELTTLPLAEQMVAMMQLIALASRDKKCKLRRIRGYCVGVNSFADVAPPWLVLDYPL
jgi:hypothetical protein